MPIGTIVKTRFSKDNSLLIIASIMPVSTKKNKEGYYDYGAFLYPEGRIDENMAFFNHEDITEVVYKGFDNEDQKEFNEFIKYSLDKGEVPFKRLKTFEEG